MPDAPWDRLAARYPRQEPLELPALRAAVALVVRERPRSVVDVGTGTGLVLRLLAEHPDRPRHAVGVDPSAAMRGRVGPLPDGYAVVSGEAAALPLDDDAADVAVASYLLHLLDPDERAAALAEARRVLRPGGTLVTVTPHARGLVGPALDAVASRAPATLSGLRTLDPAPDLLAAGLALAVRRPIRRGYPSLVLAARAPRG